MRLHNRRSNDQDKNEPTTTQTTTTPTNKGPTTPPSTSTKNSKDVNDIKLLHSEIDEMGRKLREEYIDNSNLERTDIKSGSDNLKKLQGMLSLTNRTIMAELQKMFKDQTKANSYLKNKLSDIQTTLMKVYVASVEKKIDSKSPITGTNKVAKSIDEIGNEDDGEETDQNAENDDDYYT